MSYTIPHSSPFLWEGFQPSRIQVVYGIDIPTLLRDLICQVMPKKSSISIIPAEFGQCATSLSSCIVTGSLLPLATAWWRKKQRQHAKTCCIHEYLMGGYPWCIQIGSTIFEFNPYSEFIRFSGLIPFSVPYQKYMTTITTMNQMITVVLQISGQFNC